MVNMAGRDAVVLPVIEWEGQRWTVADSQFDESPLADGAGSHWHLTLTNPQPIDPSRVKTPIRRRAGRSADKARATTSGITWLPADQVPGAVLSPQTQHELQEKLRAIDECQARARVSGASYVIYR